MPASTVQIAANQSNAQKSTGPVTEIGKSKVANNALKHGLFSKNLIMADEDPAEYQSLLGQMLKELNPSGILEHTLTERIAVSLWRQKRLLRAETAYLELESKSRKVVPDVNDELGIRFSDHALAESDLIEFDSGQYQWCQRVLKEYESINLSDLSNLAQLKKTAPLTYRQLLEDAETDQQSPEDFLREYDPPSEYFIDLARYCRSEVKLAEQRPLALEIAQLIRNKRAVLRENLRDSLSKYQVMLDNELYKAIKALREAQEWRLNTLDVSPGENGFVLENQDKN